MNRRNGAWDFVIEVTRPALVLAPMTFLDDVASDINKSGVQEAVAQRDTAALFDWLVGLTSLQGVSDARAFAFDAEHGGVRFAAIDLALRKRPACRRLRSHWDFAGCGYRKSAGSCAEPHLMWGCPLPRHPLRNGKLNQAAYSLALFLRDICSGDLVGWLDRRLVGADWAGGADRAQAMLTAVLGPLTAVYGIGSKLWSMMLADLLLAGDPARERWVTTGASMVAVDSLVHNFLHRSGILRRMEADHPYGDRCYGPGGCAEIVRGLAQRVDASVFNPDFPAVFPRFVQHALWRFGAESGLNICNGNRIDDRHPCQQPYCPMGLSCERLSLAPSP